MKIFFLLSITTLLMMATLSTNVLAEAKIVTANNPNRTIQEIKSDKNISNEKTIVIKQKVDKLVALESQNRAIIMSIMPKIVDSAEKINAIEKRSENSMKLKQIKEQFLLVKIELRNLISIDKTIKYDIDKNIIYKFDGEESTPLKSTNEEIIIFLDKNTEIALQNSKTLQNLVKEYAILLNLLD